MEKRITDRKEQYGEDMEGSASDREEQYEEDTKESARTIKKKDSVQCQHLFLIHWDLFSSQY